MARARSIYELNKLVPNATLLTVRDFGEILIGSPSEVIKPLIRKDRFPDFCVLTLRTLRQGRNLLDIEFLFYLIAFFRDRTEDKFRFVCTAEQRERILRILTETLHGPSDTDLLHGLLADGVLKPPGGAKREAPDGARRREQRDHERALLRSLLARAAGDGELDRVFEEGMRAGRRVEALVRRASPFFRDMPELRPGRHAAFARAWVGARLLRRECDVFGAYPADTAAAIEEKVDFVLFDEKGVARLRKGRRMVRIDQPEACYFRIRCRGEETTVDMRINEPPPDRSPRRRTPFVPPELGVTFLGSGTGFSPGKLTTSTVVWLQGQGVAVDLVAESTTRMRQLGVNRGDVRHVLLTHVHGDHDAGLFQRIFDSDRIHLLTTRLIHESFLRKAEAVTCIPADEFRDLYDFVELTPGRETPIPGVPNAGVQCDYGLHSIPAVGVKFVYRPPRRTAFSIAVSGDTLYDPEFLADLRDRAVLAPDRLESLLNFAFDADLIVHEAGGKPLHTEVDALRRLPQAVRQRMWINHVAASKGRLRGMRVAREGQTVAVIPARTQRGRRAHLDALKAAGLFDGFSTRELGRLLKRGRIRRVRAGAEIVREGETETDFYVLLRGMAAAEKHGAVVNEYERGDFFGEQAILANDNRRRATVRAQTDVVLFVMTEALYREYQLPAIGEENLYNLVNFFSERTAPALLGSLASGEVQQFGRGDDIILLGAHDRTAYVLLSGAVEALDAEEERLGVLEDVDVFGEIAALERVPRTATVRALSDVRVLRIDEDDFRRLLERFPSFYATVLQKKRERMGRPAELDRILRDDFGFH